jgi:hypothetical protein
MNNKSSRYIYKGLLAQPLKAGAAPAVKIPELISDLGAAAVRDAVVLMTIRHVSGFQRSGPKSRSYPSGPLRWHLKPNEQPEDKLPILRAYLGVSTDEETLLALASRHVPGFRFATPARTGGRARTMVKTGLNEAAADVDEAWLCEIIDMLREANPRKKLFAIAHELSIDKPPPGSENPGYGKDPQWIVQRYTNRKRYDRASVKRGKRVLAKLKARFMKDLDLGEQSFGFYVNLCIEGISRDHALTLARDLELRTKN